MREFPGNAVVALVVAAGIFLPAGCASVPPPKEAIPNSRIYGSGYNDVWDSVLATLSEEKIEIRSADKQSGEIVAEDRTIPLRQDKPGRYDSIYCICGSPQRHHSLGELVGEYKVSVAPAFVGTTSVRIDASYKASVYSGERFTGWLPCPSKGTFEPFFLKKVESPLDARKPPAPPSPEKVEKEKASPGDFDWWRPERGY